MEIENCLHDLNHDNPREHKPRIGSARPMVINYDDDDDGDVGGGTVGGGGVGLSKTTKCCTKIESNSTDRLYRAELMHSHHIAGVGCCWGRRARQSMPGSLPWHRSTTSRVAGRSQARSAWPPWRRRRRCAEPVVPPLSPGRDDMCKSACASCARKRMTAENRI